MDQTRPETPYAVAFGCRAAVIGVVVTSGVFRRVVRQQLLKGVGMDYSSVLFSCTSGFAPILPLSRNVVKDCDDVVALGLVLLRTLVVDIVREGVDGVGSRSQMSRVVRSGKCRCRYLVDKWKHC
jgi:hypothetical protein